MAERFANNSQTSLNGAINASQTTFTVIDASKLPTQPQFRIRVDDELMLVTGVSGNTLTVTRGVESTVATSHNNQRVVRHILTAGAIDAMAQKNSVTASKVWRQANDGSAPQGTYLSTSLDMLCTPGPYVVDAVAQANSAALIAWLEAVAATGLGGCLTVPDGMFFSFKGSITSAVAGVWSGVHIRGAGQATGVLLFRKTIQDEAFLDVSNAGNGHISDFSIRDVAIQGQFDLDGAIAIRLYHVRAFHLRLHVNHWSKGTTGAHNAIAIVNGSHEAGIIEGEYTADQVCINVPNPASGGGSDHVVYRDFYPSNYDQTKPNMIYTGGAGYTRQIFEGFQAWVGDGGAIQAVGLTGGDFHLNNIRAEGGAHLAFPNPIFDFEGTSGAYIEEVHFSNCASYRVGYKGRYVGRMSIDKCRYEDEAGHNAIDVDGTVLFFEYNNISNANGSMSTTGLTRVWGTPLVNQGVGNYLPLSAVFVPTPALIEDTYMQRNGVKEGKWHLRMAPNDVITIADYNTWVAQTPGWNAAVTVTGCSTTDSTVVTGIFSITRAGAGIIVNASNNLEVVNIGSDASHGTAGKMTMFLGDGLAVKLRNNVASTVDITVSLN